VVSRPGRSNEKGPVGSAKNAREEVNSLEGSSPKKTLGGGVEKGSAGVTGDFREKDRKEG